MLIVFQNPFTDIRDFLEIDTYQLLRPDWKRPQFFRFGNFIRRFGAVEKGISSNNDWIDNEIYCHAKKAFKFDTDDVCELMKYNFGLIMCGRRLFPVEIREVGKTVDGVGIPFLNKATCSLEVGFIHANKNKFKNIRTNFNQLEQVLKKCLDLHITVNLPSGEIKKNNLYNIGSYLPSLYLHATTEAGHFKEDSNWILSGAPMLVVEYKTNEIDELPTDSKHVVALDDLGINVYWKALKYSAGIGIWYIVSTEKSDRKKVQLIINGLLNMNACRESLNGVLHSVTSLNLIKGSQANERFQRFLELAFGNLFKRNRFGFPCKELAELVQRCQYQVSSQSLDFLRLELMAAGVRGNYLRNLQEFACGAYFKNFSKTDELMLGIRRDRGLLKANEERRVDILILVAVKDELDTILKSEENWNKKNDGRGYDYYVREDTTAKGEPITIALSRPVEMGDVFAANLATRLISEMNPACIAMAGICAGWRNKVELGDVIVGERVFFYDTGKLRSFADGHIKESEFFGDIRTYNLDPKWKLKAEDFSDDWIKGVRLSRPRTYHSQELWLLSALYDKKDPLNDSERKTNCPDWTSIIKMLEKRKLVKIDRKGLSLTKKGEEEVKKHHILYPDGAIEKSIPKVHVKPIASGDKVVEDRGIFTKIAHSIRTVHGIEMEGAAIGAVAEVEGIRNCIVVKSVSDFADEEKNDYFRYYAIETSYRFLMAFLKENFKVEMVE